MSHDTLVPCIVCGHSLENLDDSSSQNQPMRATEFTTHGHYGSTTFDPMDGTQLAINVCDKCLVEARRAKRVLHVTSLRSTPTLTYTVWEDEDLPNPS